ncbi:MAG: biotin/lipoyl-binding protein, partial [Gammaproteobacteria bacterium]
MYRLEMTSRTPAASALLATVLLALAGCSQGGQDAGGPGRGPGDRPLGSGGPPPAEVLVANGQVRAFGAALEAVGTALARESVDITSKVANTVTAIRFQEGQRVAAGSVLVELDRAQVAAALAEAEASLLESRNQFNRGRDLSVTQALSRAQLDQLET